MTLTNQGLVVGQATKTDIHQRHTLVMMSCIYYVRLLPNVVALTDRDLRLSAVDV